MKNVLKTKVYYSDTDAYGVVWHGSYLRWLEMGRVELSEDLGLKLKDLLEQDITLPVIELNVRYKSSALLDDNIIVETSISKMSRMSITFEQIIKNAETEKVNVIASVTIVAITNSGQLYKTMPEVLKTAYEKAMQSNLASV